jgi:hypothetical protein
MSSVQMVNVDFLLAFLLTNLILYLMFFITHFQYLETYN